MWSKRWGWDSNPPTPCGVQVFETDSLPIRRTPSQKHKTNASIFSAFPQRGKSGKALLEEDEVNVRQYAKRLLKEGSVSDKRELLANLRSRLNYKDKKIILIGE